MCVYIQTGINGKLKFSGSHKNQVFLWLMNALSGGARVGGNPQKLTQLSSRSHPRQLVGKRTAYKHTIKDITSDSQVNSHLPHRWSPASLTINIYFYLFKLCHFLFLPFKEERICSYRSKKFYPIRVDLIFEGPHPPRKQTGNHKAFFPLYKC